MRGNYISRYWKKVTAGLFYLPVVLYVPFLLIKYRLFPNSISLVNFCFDYGGLFFDSKFSMLDKFSRWREYLAKSFLLKRSFLENHFIPDLYLKSVEIEYPFILKPDRGRINNKLQVIKNETEFLDYISHSDGDLFIQEFIDSILEYEVFWLKPPYHEGCVYTITRKKKLNTGDSIYENGGMDLRSKTLIRLIEICESVEGFEYGKLNIKFKTPESLSNGRDFKLLKVAGTGSEITHIYDSSYSVFYKYRLLLNQWDNLLKIARANKDKGFKPVSFFVFIKSILGL